MASGREHAPAFPGPGNSPAADTSSVKPARLFRRAAFQDVFRQHFTPREADLLFLSCGEYELRAQADSQSLSYSDQETLLFIWQGQVEVSLDEWRFALCPCDTLYVPLGASFRLRNTALKTARVVQ